MAYAKMCSIYQRHLISDFKIISKQIYKHTTLC